MTSQRQQPPLAKLIRVLLVEADPGDAFLLTALLGEAPGGGFEITLVARLSEATARLDREAFDVVLLDLALPDSQSLETYARVAPHALGVPVIALSGRFDEAVASRTVELGAQDYLVKGEVNAALLTRSIRHAIKRAEADRTLATERNLLRSVIDHLVDAVYVKDCAGKYLLGNAAHASQLGLPSPEEVVGKTSRDLFPPEVAASFASDDERVLKTGEPVINRHEKIEDAEHPTRWLSTTKVPLRDPGGEIVGVIGIGRDITARKNAEEQLARYTEELREKNAEMEDDLEMAREVQQAFLPQQFPTFPRDAAPERSTLQFSSRYLPTTTLGGDFFHVMPISETAAGVLICDVMGHGVRAALVTAIQRALVEELTDQAADPASFLTQMNHALLSILRRTRSPMFASAFYAVVDSAAGTLLYANAGHPRPLHVRRSLSLVSLLDGPGTRPGPALGVFEHSRYVAQQVKLDTGDLLLMFTDGVYEVENANGEFYDQGLLQVAVQNRLHHSTGAMLGELLEEVRGFSATGGFVDDVCLLGVDVCSSQE